MTTKADVAEANLKVTQTRKALTEFWEKALDTDGNFDWTFGDPAATEFAVRIWVGYDESDSVLVDVIYPVSENALVKDEEGLFEADLKAIEDLAYESSGLLDKDVAEFAHTIYNYLQGVSNHQSLVDTLWNDWVHSKDYALEVTAAYKRVVQGEKPQPVKTKSLKMLSREYVRRMKTEAARRQAEMQAAREASVRQAAAFSSKHREEIVQARGWMLFQDLTQVPTDPLSTYLQRVFAFESPFLLWQKEGLTTIPTVISRIPWLQEVNFSQNNLSVIPQELCSLPKLKRLFLYGNKLKVLPNLGNLAELEILDVHDNLIAVIPSDIGLVSRLQSLDFEKNRIRVIPTEVGELKQLDHLNVAKNLIKIVPSSLVELKNLSYLNLKLNPIVNLPPHIYLQGTAASMAYLKSQLTDSSQIQASSMVTDFSVLKNRAPESTPGVTLPQDSRFLADLILRSTPGENNDSEPVESHQVHRVIICARSSVIAETLHNIKKTGIELPIDPTSGLPVLALKLSGEQLKILVTYLYTDGFNVPELSLVATSLTMPEEKIVEAVKMNQLMTLNHSKSLERASETASTFKLAYLKYLVDKNLRAVEVQNSRYLEDFKTVYRRLVDVESSLDDLSIPVPSSSISEATKIEQPTSGLLPACDITFTFPLHPDIAPISAHKAILCARSKFLSSLLTGGLLESKQRIVELNDIEPSVFKNIVEFCYTDDVYNLCGETIMDLLAAARLYGLDRLLGIVESVVGYSLDVDNVSGILSISRLYSLVKLGRACKFFILSNWESVTSSEGWKELSEMIKTKLTSTALEWGIIE